jgi:hypothetical protein
MKILYLCKRITTLFIKSVSKLIRKTEKTKKVKRIVYENAGNILERMLYTRWYKATS